MRYEDASHTGAFVQGSEPDARNDADAIAAGSNAPATGNVITGEGTQTGPSGSDYGPGAHITTIAGAGGEDSSFAGGKLAVSGEFGRLSIDAEGNYSYQAKPNTPENSVDRFTYTLADGQGAADTATLTIEIGKTPAVIKANAQQVVPGPDGVVILPPGVELSDVHIVGRNLVIDLPDGGQMVIVDGAVFVPQLVLGGVEVPATNLAALLVGQEIAPAEGGPPQSSGGNFEVPVAPLDPGVPLGDLIPPTEYGYTPPEVKEVFDLIDEEPEIFFQPDGQPAAVNAVDSVDEHGLPERNEGEPEGSGEEAAAGANGDPSEATGGTIIINSPDGIDSLTIAGSDGIPHEIAVGLIVHGAYGSLEITGIVDGNYTYSYVLTDNIDHSDGLPDFEDFSVTLTDNDGDQVSATLHIDIIDDTPTARPDTDVVPAGEFGPVTGNVITDDSAGDEGDGDNGHDTVGADDASLTNVTGFGSTEATEGGWTVQGQYGVLTINDDGSYSYLRNEDSPGGVSDVFTYTLTDGDGDTSATTLTITIEDAIPELRTPGAAQLDDDTFPGGNPGGTGDVNPDTANLSGNLAGSGGDGDLDYAFTGTNTLPAGFSVDPSSTATTLKIAQAGVGVVMTITLDLETGAYTVTQNQPIDHPAGSDENDLTFGIGVQTTDIDGDSAVSTLTINVDDDTPLAFNDTDTVSAGTASGNVITGVGTTEGAANADKPGADGLDAITQVSGFGGTDSDATGGFTVNGQYGSLQMAADGSYTYTRNDGLGGGQSEVFTYTFRDGDGDLASATLTINIPDAVPQLGTPAAAQLDDDTFPGGNPGGTGDVNPDTANLSGNLAGSGGDGDLDYAFTGTDTLPAGFSIDPSSTATTLKIAQAGVGVVLTVTLDLETGAYTVTQNQPIDHPAGLNENDLTFGIGVKVIDVDGDSAINTLTINVDDDTPLAFNDTDTVSAGTASGNVITGVGTTEGAANADKPGADGLDAITQVSGFGGTDSDATGGFTVNGQYGSLQMAADGSYTYTRNDGLGGGQSEVFTYTFRDGDGDLASATLTISIPDAAPLLGTPAPAQLDDDTFAGGNPGGTGDVNPDTANLSGNLAGSGGDGDLDYAFTGTNTLPAGFTVDASSTPTSLKIAQAGVGIVMTITLDLETGAYTVTQNLPMDHPAGLNENDLTFGIGVKVVDVDGDSAINTLTINVDDDTPLAFNDTDTIPGGGSSATGNVITGSGTVEGTANADKPGADGFDTITGVSSNSTSNSDTDASGGFTVVGQYGSLQMAADGTYTYTRAGGGAGNVSESFVYTYRDGDGDLASATLTINIQDAAPLLGTPAPAQLDDDALAGGNPGGTGDVNPDTANLSGNLAGSGGDGDLDYAFTGTNTLPAGFTVDPTSTASTLYIAQAGVGIVMTITLDLETGAYTVTQNLPMDHPAGSNENDLTFGIGVKVVDVDGDSAINTLTINADDDTPLAFNDTDSITSGGSSATGNVITGSGTNEGTGNADKPGADGYDTVTNLSGSGSSDSNPSGGFTAIGTYGTLQMDAAGNYTYTRANGDPLTATDTFTYTYRDGDGDLASATLTINIADAVPTLGTPAAAQLDDDTFAGGNPGGTGDVNPDTANLSGNLAGSGGDGDLDYAFTGTNTLPAGFTVDASSTPTSLKIAQAGVGIVMTITLDLETGAYTVTQNLPMDHPAGLNENDLTFGIGVKVIDVDGDSAINTLTINVDDDTPLAFNDTDTVSAGTASGNVITGVGTTEGAANADKPGADGLDTITSLSGSGGSDSNPTGGFTAPGTYGTLQMAADGSYTYTRAPNTAGGVSESFTYTYRDGDGDLASATLTISIPDAAPTLPAPALAQLDDDAFPGGNAGGTGDVNPDTANLSGSLAGTGGDGDLDYAFTGTNTLPAGFTASVNPAGTILQVSQAGVGVVLTVTLDLETGAYTVVQNQPIDHPTSGTTEENLDFGIGVKVIDVDGDSATSTLSINVDDDTPTLGTIQDQTASNTPGDPVSTGTLHFSDGGDSPGSVVNITADNTGITSGGKALVTHLDGNVLTAYQDANGSGTYDAGDTTAVYTLTVNPTAGTSGNYVFDLLQPLDSTVVDTPIGGSSSFGAGPEEQGQILQNVGSTVDLAVVSGYHMGGTFDEASWLATGNAGPSTNFTTAGVNGSTAGWGIDNNNFNGTDEMFVWDFGSQALRDPDGAGGYVPAAGVTLPDISTATFQLIGYTSADDISYVVHYTDGTTFDSGHIPAGDMTDGTWVFVADAGKFIADVEMFTSGTGSGKVDLVSVGIQSSSLDETIDFNVTLSDADGDQVSGGFSVNVADGNSPTPPAALVAQQSTLAVPADDTSSFSSLLASDSQLQKTAANSNTTLLAAAVAASGLAGTQAAASSGNTDHGHHVVMDTPSVASKFAGFTVDSGDESRSILSNEMKVAANDEPQTLQSSHGTEDFSSSVQGLDNAPAHLPADLSAFFGAADHGPAVDAAAAGPVAPAVAMVSADALKAAGVDGTAKHGGAVDKVVADALGHDAPPTVDGLLQALAGHGGGQLAAISHVASPAADAVPAWDMGSHGAFVPGADMMFKMGAEMLHHDAVQPVVNG